MNDFDKYEEMLPDYITGRLREDQRRELENRLKESTELRKALEETRLIAAGLTVMDAVAAGHIDSEHLVTYSDHPGDLDVSVRREIETHLKECVDCREELQLCRTMPDTSSQDKSLFHSFFDWLMTPRYALRPVYAMAAVLVLVLPLTYLATTHKWSAPVLAEFTLESTSRDVQQANIFVIDPGVPVIRLKFVVPVIAGYRYDINLHDLTGRMIFAKPNNFAQNLLAIDIPTSYLQDGRYQLRIMELGTEAAPKEMLVFDFSVQFKND